MEKEGLRDLVDELDNKLFGLLYIDTNYQEAKKLWNSIKSDELLLLAASEVTKDIFNEKDIFVGNCIVELILKNPTDVNIGIYEDIVNKIYINDDLSKIVLNGYLSEGCPFLLYTLMNDNLKLTGSQKDKVYNLAMEQFFTEKNGSYGGMFYLSTKNGCGNFPYDIRYWILHNNNWNEDEKLQMIYDFYSSEEFYARFLNCLELEMQSVYMKEDISSAKEDICYMKLEDLNGVIENDELKNDIIEKTKFIKTLRRFRRPKYLIESE